MRRISDKRLVISDKRRNADIAHVPYYFSFLCALCCLLLLWGCDRRDITYYTEAEFSIRVDWSNSRLDAEESGYGATAVFYPQDGSFPITVLMGDRNSERVRLHTGRYDVIVFNRSFTDFGSLAFRGEGFRGLEAYSRDVETRTDPVTRTETRVIVSSPEKLASGVTEGFEVSEEMLGNYSAPSSSHSRSGMSSGTGSDDYTLSFAPLCLTREVKVQINVTGLNNDGRKAFGSLERSSVGNLIDNEKQLPTANRLSFGHAKFFDSTRYLRIDINVLPSTDRGRIRSGKFFIRRFYFHYCKRRFHSCIRCLFARCHPHCTTDNPYQP